jgi:alpha-L-fucosidase
MKLYPKPTARHLEWADCEIGVLIHYDIQVFHPLFEPGENFGKKLPTSIFNPAQLDTDQWIGTAAKAGAKYAVLTAKHGTGFSLWPTKAHDYNVANTPFGKDIVGQFVQSCRKYSVKPGLYYHCSFNGFLAVDNPGRVISGDAEEQKKYCKIVETQVQELWSQYGELFEIWFDGGVLPPAEGGPDIMPILMRYQPNAVCFQAPISFPTVLRWVGNEDGSAPYPCWSTSVSEQAHFDGTIPCINWGRGDPDGNMWAPAETDMPIRRHTAYGGGWMWREGEDDQLYTLDELMECYYNSVGCNTNLLIGMVVDDKGLIPQADADLFEQFGRAINDRFSCSVGECCGTGNEIFLHFDMATIINTAILMEDIKYGERVRQYELFAITAYGEMKIAEGSCIGHKRIERYSAIEAIGLKLLIESATDLPVICKLSGLLIT